MAGLELATNRDPPAGFQVLLLSVRATVLSLILMVQKKNSEFRVLNLRNVNTVYIRVMHVIYIIRGTLNVLGVAMLLQLWERTSLFLAEKPWPLHVNLLIQKVSADRA